MAGETGNGWARYGDRLHTIVGGLLVAGISGLAWINYTDHDLLVQNQVSLAQIQEQQQEAKLERILIKAEFMQRNEKWLSKEYAQQQFSAIVDQLSDHEDRIRVLERKGNISIKTKTTR